MPDCDPQSILLYIQSQCVVFPDFVIIFSQRAFLIIMSTILFSQCEVFPDYVIFNHCYWTESVRGIPWLCDLLLQLTTESVRGIPWFCGFILSPSFTTILLIFSFWSVRIRTKKIPEAHPVCLANKTNFLPAADTLPSWWSLKILIYYHVSCAWRINKDQQDVWLIIPVILIVKIYISHCYYFRSLNGLITGSSHINRLQTYLVSRDLK